MKRFSERIGAVKPPPELQINDMTNDLRNSLWNIVFELYENRDNDYWIRVTKHFAIYFAKIPVDDLPYRMTDRREWLRKYFYSLKWYETYDFIEFLTRNHEGMTYSREDGGFDHKHRVRREKLLLWVNNVLERELSGYRFIDGILSPITTKVEMESIEDALQTTAIKGLLGAHEHLETALRLLGKKPAPDYRNSIKESISAIESMAKIITKQDGGGLKDALNELCRTANVHNSLRQGFLNLYGYTSDEDGIRHAILEQADIGFAEAKYMLVTCSAFVNYLVIKNDIAKSSS